MPNQHVHQELHIHQVLKILKKGKYEYLLIIYNLFSKQN